MNQKPDQLVNRQDSSQKPSTDTKTESNKSQEVKYDKHIRWETLQGLDYKTGKVGKDLKPFLNRVVRIPGFVVPLDLSGKSAKKFLLVPTYGACIHTPPPPANQMILVNILNSVAPRREKGPVWVEGTLSTTEFDTPWGKAGFIIETEKTEPYKGGY